MTMTSPGRRAAEHLNNALSRPDPQVSQIDRGAEAGSFSPIPGSPYIQRITREVSALLRSSRLDSRTIQAMRSHYQIASCLLVQTLPLIQADAGIECDDPDIAEFATKAWELVALDLMRSAGRALWAGFSPNVLVYNQVAELQNGIAVTKIRDLPPFTCKALVTDPVTQRYAGIVQHEGTSDEQMITNPLQTFWLTEGMESGDLYGRSILEAAREPWQDWLAIRLFHLRYLERFGEPVVKTRGPDRDIVVNQAEVNAAIMWNADHPDDQRDVPERNVVSGMQVARTMGEQLRHHSVAAMPSERSMSADGKDIGYVWDLEFLEAKSGGGADFVEALAQANRSMARAMFVPDLLMSNTEAGSWALGKEHRTVFDLGVEGRLDDYARQITRHFIRRLVRLNFGENAPDARLVFAPPASDDSDKLWELAQSLVAGQRLPVDVAVLGERLGIPISLTDDELDEAQRLADQEQADAQDDVDLAASRGQRPTILLAAADSLPEWKRPQAEATTDGWRRALTPREGRIGLKRVEDELNAAERDTIAALVELLEKSRARVLKQLAGIMKKGSAAEIIEALSTIEFGPDAPYAEVLRKMVLAIWGVGLGSVSSQLPGYAEQIPATPGVEGNAIAKALAVTAAASITSKIANALRIELLNAYRSGVTPAGMDAVVSALYDREASSEGRTLRLTARMLSAKAMNEARADAIQRGGVPLAGAQYSAILDHRVCGLCAKLDEKVIAVENLDILRFTPPIHHNCRCLWVYITREEADFTPDWPGVTPAEVERFGSLVF